MHPYIYQLTVEALEIEKQRHYENQRWLRDLPKQPSRIQTLRRILSLHLMSLLKRLGRSVKEKSWQAAQPIEQECVLPSTEAG